MRSPANRLEHNDRPPLRLNAVDWVVYAIVVVATLGAWAYSCWSTPNLQQCMRDGARLGC